VTESLSAGREGHGLGMAEAARRWLTGLADDGLGGQLETVTLRQHFDFRSPAVSAPWSPTAARAPARDLGGSRRPAPPPRQNTEFASPPFTLEGGANCRSRIARSATTVKVLAAGPLSNP
jgi:hypothetical protein